MGHTLISPNGRLSLVIVHSSPLGRHIHLPQTTCVKMYMDRWGKPTSGCGLGQVLERGCVHAYFSGHEHVNQFCMHGDTASFVCGSVADPRFYRGCDEQRKRMMDWVDTEGKVGFVAVTITPMEMIVRFVTAPSCEVVQTVRVPRRK